LANGEFAGVAEIDRPREAGRRFHEANETIDEIVDIAEGPRLRAIAEHGDRFVLECLNDKIGNNAPVIGMHARAIGIEDARDFDRQLVLTMIVEEKGLRAAFAFVVAGARADRVNISPIAFRLRMYDGVSVYLAR